MRTLKQSPIFLFSLSLLLMNDVSGQVCSNPGTIIYGMDGNGFIYPINTTNASVGARINPVYPGNSPASPNAMGYNTSNGRFYYFKRNADQGTQEFVSFNPTTNTYTILASCPTTYNIKTGCVNYTSSGYYCIDTYGDLYFYRFSSNMWRKITGTYFNQWGTDITTTVRNHTSGDIAMDGFGVLWFLCSDATTYGLYKFPAALPTVTVASLTLTQKIAPTTPTPGGQTFAGISFNPTGQIFLDQRGNDRLYRLENNLTLTLLGTFSTSGVGDDLTSCNYPMAALASNWQSFTLEGRGTHEVSLKWSVVSENIKGYYIEVSSDAENWQTLGFVESKNSGLTADSYSFVHTSYGNGRQYYRIRQVSLDETYSYSEIKFRDGNQKDIITIGPNPTKGSITLKNNDYVYTRISIMDLSGRLIKESALSIGFNSISLFSLPRGTYIVRLHSDSNQPYHQKIIKE